MCDKYIPAMITTLQLLLVTEEIITIINVFANQ